MMNKQGEEKMAYDADLVSMLHYVQQHDSELAQRLLERFLPEMDGSIILENGDKLKSEYVEMIKQAYKDPRSMDPGLTDISPDRRRVTAIKKTRYCTGWGLYEAKVAVDQLIKRNILVA
jgi:hypothetical protein